MTNGYDVYLPFEVLGMIKIETDSVNNWQRVYKLKRVEEFSKTTYKNLDIPLQIREYYINNITSNSVQFNMNRTEDASNTKCYIDNVLYKQFNPGYADKLGEYNYYSYFALSGLEIGIEYAIKVTIENAKGEMDTIQFNIKI